VGKSKSNNDSLRHLFTIYRWALSFLKLYRWSLVAVIGLGIVATLSELVIPKFIQHMIDVVIPAKDFGQLKLILLTTVGVIIVMVTVKALRNLVQRQMSEKASRDSQFASFQQLRDLGFAYFERNSVGDTLSFMNTQTQAVQKIYRQYLPNMIENIIFPVISILFMLQISARLTLVMVPCFLFYYIFGPMLEKKATVYGRNFGQSYRAISQKTYESMAAMTEVRSFGREEWDRQRLAQMHEPFQHNYVKSMLFAYLRGSNRRISCYIGAIAVFMYGAIMVQQHTLSTGGFVAFILYYFWAMHVLTVIVTNVTEQKLLLYQIEPLYQFMQLAPEVVESAHPSPLAEVRGEITFADVHFGYENRGQVLEGFDLHIRAGERVALVGRSGGGKSTLVKLLGRFYDPQAGAVLLDGVPLQDLSFAQLRESIGFVFQETYLFGTSIRENIRFGKPNATDEEVIEAAKLAYCHEFVMQLEHGYDTHVGERGFKLSGGQKQRIAIARMLIKNPRIVLLDEATSAMDNVNERAVQDALDQLLAGRTVIAIAHRLSTIQDFDRIVYVDQGQNLEMGSYQELMDRRGLFYQLAVGQVAVEEVVV
jgi:ATP-binding cassette subfamily B protein